MQENAVRLIDDRYAAVTELGSGGFGTVYLVMDTRTQERAALKFLSGGQDDAFERFQREARILSAQRDNPNVVRLRGHNLNHAPPYIVMEFCEGGSLRSWVRARKTWREVAAALMHALLGLNSLHEAGGFHRDLKPENLLMATHPTQAGRLIIKVADWGLARAPGSQSPMTRNLAGTRGYIAPEVLGGADYDARADIFSLGVVAAELLTGDPSGESLGAASIPDKLRAVVRQMLSPQPAARPTARAIAQALQEMLNAENVPAAPESNGVGSFILGGLLFGGALMALAALAEGNGPAPGPARPKV